MPKTLPLLSLVLVVATAISAAASSIQINDETTFVNQTGAAFHSLPVVLCCTQTFFYTANGLSFLNANGVAIASQDPVEHPPIPWAWVGLSGPEDLNVGITNTTHTHSFGMSIYQPTDPGINGCNTAPTPCVHDKFSVTMELNGTFVASFVIDPPDDQSQFFGFWLDNPFNQILIRDLSHSIDNEFFGTFYTGDDPYTGNPPALPEPGSLLFCGSGLALLAGAIRNKRLARK